MRRRRKARSQDNARRAAGTGDKGSRDTGRRGGAGWSIMDKGTAGSLVPPCAGTPRSRWHVGATSSWGDGDSKGTPRAVGPNQCPDLRRGIFGGWRVCGGGA